MKLQTFVFSVLILCSLSTFAQLTIKTVDPGPYTPGSTISATFSISNAILLEKTNIFQLVLSDATGTFSPSSSVIGTFSGFYSSFVNGEIPPGTPVGTGYKVMIRTSNPTSIVSNSSAPFAIVAGTAVKASLTSTLYDASHPEVFATCNGTGSFDIILSNQSTAGSVVDAVVTNELSAVVTPVAFTTTNMNFNANLAHYTIFTRAVGLGGSIATKSYLIINNEAITAFTTGSSNIVCLPQQLQYTVDEAQLANNFPGNVYKITWGDGTMSAYSLNEIRTAGGKVSHVYNTSSCGNNVVTSSETVYNAFSVSINSTNAYCGNIGVGISATAKVVEKAVNNFSFNTIVCLNQTSSFSNTSVAGQNPNVIGPCAPNTITYNWYVDGVAIEINKSPSYNFQYIFSTPGQHIVKLTANLPPGSSCIPDPVEHTVCVQTPPVPSFTLPATVGCASSFTLTPTNTSVIDVACGNNLTYLWTVSPATGFTFNTSETTATPPSISFTAPGIYTIGLRITSGSCGVYNAPTKTITVNNLRTVTLSPDVSLCTPGVFNFSTVTGPTKTAYTGSEVVLDDAYSWTVTSANGGTWSFVTPASSKYPQIEFNNFDIYTVTSTVTNVCGTTNSSQVITFIQSPIPGVTSPTDPICQSAPANLTGSIAGTYTSFQWIGAGTFSTGKGPFLPAQSANLLSSYTPSAAERAAGSATIILRINTGLGGACAQIDKTFTVGIVRQNSGIDKSQTICSGSNALLNLVSTVTGSNYTWAAALSTGNAMLNASGSAASGGRINETITNPSNTTAAVVVYTITPISFGCSGTPFTFTVTVDPVLTATPSISTPIICSGATTGITLVPSIVGTKFTWTSTSTSAQLTGNSTQATAKVITSLNDVLINIGTTTETVTYTFTPISSNGCSGTPINQIVQVYPRATPSNAGADAAICGIVNGTSSFTLSANQPSVGTGSWSIVPVQTDVVFANITDPKTSVSNLRNGEIYTFRWTISIPNGCAASSDDVKITVVRPTIAGTAGGDATVCASGNSGTVSLSGQTGAVLSWQISTDNSATWQSFPAAGTNTTFTYTNLTVTSQFRAIVQNDNCTVLNSTSATIVVTLPPTTANAGPDNSTCGAPTYILNGNIPIIGTGLWTVKSSQTDVTFSDATSPTATATGLRAGETYKFRWTITAPGACSPSYDDILLTVNFATVGGTTTGATSVCSGSNSGSITLSGQTGSILRWERSVDNGANWIPIASSATNRPYSNITITTQYRAVVQNTGCNIEFSTISTVTVNPQSTIAAAGAYQVLCNEISVVLTANSTSSNETGAWALVTGSTVSFVNAASPNTTVNGLIPGQSYTFRWTITGLAPCPPTSDDVTVVSLQPLTNTINTLLTDACFGQVININGSTPTGGTGLYIYTWESSTDGITWNPMIGKTSKDLSYTLTSTLTFRRKVSSGPCLLQSNEIKIIAQPPISNNTISANQTICADTAPAPLTGNIPSGGDGNYMYQWQASTNAGGTWTNVNGAVNKDYAPPILTTTTMYRRLASTAACSGLLQNTSGSINITVNPNAKAAYTYTIDKNCKPFAITSQVVKAIAYPDRNATYTWYADNIQIGTGASFPGYTIKNSNETVTIKLVTTSSLGCSQSEFSHVFSTTDEVIAGFTQSTRQGCGPLNVNFVNTSSSLTNATFKWNFGNGTTSSQATPGQVTFLPDPTGYDIVYTIILTATTPCSTSTDTAEVLVKGRPISIFSPDKTLGCSPFAVNFTNTSPASNATYYYDFGDGTTLTTTNKASVQHTYSTNVVVDYVVKMVTENECGRDESSYIIRVSPNSITPELVVNGNILIGCAPFTVNFSNNTKGASAYTYNFGDGAIINTSKAPEVVQHTFTNPGFYTVTLFATNGCSSASTTENITVLEQPITAFTANKTIGCSGMLVQFKNESVNGVSYLWDFGDGTTSIEFEPTHIFTGPGKNFTVSLTTVNKLGCPTTLSKSELIQIVKNPVSAFTVLPGNEIKYPNFTFDFKDISTDGAVRWDWDFGDKVASTLQNPSHTYRELGTYTVQLTVTNKEGCAVQSIQAVTVLGIPSLLTVPNAFMPGSQKAELRTFMAKGKGIAEWRMTVFNKWGQVLWETTQLQNDAPMDGWDGTFKGQPQPQGTYFWKIEVKFINGSKWAGVTYNGSPAKTTGVIYLMR